MCVSSRTTVFVVALVAVPLLFVARTFTQTVPSDLAEVRLQLADLMFAEGRFPDALEAYNAARDTEDLRLRRRALRGAATSSLRLAEFTDAAEDAEALIKLSPRDAETIALQGDTLWAVGRFLDSEARFDAALAVNPESARALHGHARSLASRGQLDEALNGAQAALRLSPRDAEIHHTVGSVYERLRRYEAAVNAFGNYVNLLPNKDHSAKADWSRSEIGFLRNFANKVPMSIDPKDEARVHVIPFKIVNDKVVVRARVNHGPLMDFTLDTGSERTVITQDTARRLGIRALSVTLSAGVGDFMLRGLQLGRLESLTIGSLEIKNVPCLIKSPPLRNMPAPEAEGFSPVSLGFSMIVDYARHELLIAREIPEEPADHKLPLRVHRLAMVQGTVDGGPANFVVDTGGEVISISADTASGLGRTRSTRHIPLKVYGTSGWDRDAFLLPGVNLSFQGIQYSNFPVVVLNLRAPSVLLGFQLGGIVGHKFLSPYRVAIDLKASEVRMRRLAG